MNEQLRIDAQVFELHQLIADEMERRPEKAMRFARKALMHWRSINGGHPYYREWNRLLDRGANAVVALLREESEQATLMRSVSPLSAFLPREREAIFVPRRRT